MSMWSTSRPRGHLRGDYSRDEELGPIGIFARIGHAEHSRLAVLQLEIFIGKLRAVDGLSPGSYRTHISLSFRAEEGAHIPSPLVKSPPWIMKDLMIRWKVDPS